MSEEAVNIDWLGNPYSVGTYVVYGASGGRSINMVFGRVVRINPTGTVTIQPLESSRWEQHTEHKRYIDKRTGKGIDPYNDKHILKQYHWIHDLTGRGVSYQERYAQGSVWHKPNDSYTWVPSAFHDYVEELSVPIKPVTLTVIENITVWLGSPPEGIEE